MDKLQDVSCPGQWKEVVTAKEPLIKILLEKPEETSKEIQWAREGEVVFIQDFFSLRGEAILL